MIKHVLAGLAILASGTIFAGEPLFKVDSSHEGLSVPYHVCANGKAQLTCYRFVADGKELFIQSKSKKPVFPDAGIQLQVPGYKINGCTPYANGYCLFNLTNSSYSRLVLTSQ